jgi:polyisoprenoid-binding protein YceI
MLHVSSFAIRCFHTVIALCLVGTAASAQQTEGADQASPAPGDLNTDVSRVYIFVDKTGLGHQHAVEGNLASGKLLLGAQSAAGTLVFDMISFDADTSRARKYIGLAGTTDASTRSKVNANMKGSQVLGVQRYPIATFHVSSALPTGNTGKRDLPTYRLKGTFTLRRVTRPLVVVADVEQSDGWLHVRGNFVIKQTDFGIKPYSKVFGAIGVADALRIYGDLWVAPTEPLAIDEIPTRK